MAFYYVYKALAHPEHDGYVKAFTLEERLMHIAEAERTLGSRIPWLADNMSNDLKTALGGVNNAELVIDGDGRVVRRRAWSDPDELRRDLGKLVGRVKNPTRVSDLELATAPPPATVPPAATVAEGVVPRVKVPGPMRALEIEPIIEGEEHPFYVKLRAEVDRGFLRSGEGKLYLGFHLDPLYSVHWNNLAKPLELEIETPPGIHLSRHKMSAPKVEEPADADPREFLLDLRAEQRGTFELTARYFACDNADTFCVPVSQSYRVHLRPDANGGTSRARGRMAGGGMGGGRSGAPGGFGDPVSFFMSFDADGDGRITRDEAPDRMKERFGRMDANGDGAIDADEIRSMAERMGGRGRGRGRPGSSSGANP